MNPSIEVLFNQGNYAAVAMDGDPEQWQTHAALGLIGKTKEALEGLSQFKNEEATFYSAVASWIEGDDARAIKLLQNVSIPHAQNLLGLIKKPQLKILAQLVAVRTPPLGFSFGIRTRQEISDPKHQLASAGSAKQTLWECSRLLQPQ